MPLGGQFYIAGDSKVNYGLLLVSTALFIVFIALTVYSAEQRQKERNRPIQLLDSGDVISLSDKQCALTSRCGAQVYFYCGAKTNEKIAYFAKRLSANDNKIYTLIQACQPQHCTIPESWRCELPALGFN